LAASGQTLSTGSDLPQNVIARRTDSAIHFRRFTVKVLFAVDSSKYSRRAIDYLAEHKWLSNGSELHVFTVVLPVPHRAAAMAGPALTHGYYADDAEQALRPVREAFEGLQVKAAYGWSLGHPGEEIARKAEDEEFDLVVMGSHGQTALANVVMGSVATQVLARCRVPVLLVR
jgi:nucleotide-binding universal stress UspA family protein